MSSKYNGPAKEVAALNTFIKLTRATDTINSSINNFLVKKGFTESQFRALDALYHLGPLSQKSLGQKLHKSGGNITMVIDNLEKRNYVKRKRGIEDRRQFLVHLTKKGGNQIKEIMPSLINILTEEFKILSKAEQNELQILLKKVGLKQK